MVEIPSVLRLDGSPPLYYVVLNLWMELFGSGDVATHARALLFAALCVPASYWAGRTLFGRRTAHIAAVLAASSPFLTHFARETPMYSLVTAAGAARHRHLPAGVGPEPTSSSTCVRRITRRAAVHPQPGDAQRRS